MKAVANGDEALQQALKEPPDILVTDILMPLSGYWKRYLKRLSPVF